MCLELLLRRAGRERGQPGWRLVLDVALPQQEVLVGEPEGLAGLHFSKLQEGRQGARLDGEQLLERQREPERLAP